MPKTLTVCFQLKENEGSEQLIDQLKERFAIGEEEIEKLDYTVSAMSTHDEFHRLELIEQAAEDSSFEAIDQIREILSLANFEGIKTLDDLHE